MRYYTQTDPLWKDDSMALSNDKLWRWGCLVTALTNILNELTGVVFTPKQFNQQLKDNKGYLGLKYPNTSVSNYSCLSWNAVIDIYGIIVEFDIPKDKYEEKHGYFYIAGVIHPLTNDFHYINLLRKENDNWVCFDVEDGKIKNYIKDQIKRITRIRSKSTI